MAINRREFLQRGLAGATLLATAPTLPGFLTRTALAATRERRQRCLVVVQLTGGNDGLNTVIPYADDRYHRARPTLRVGENEVLRLSDTLGLHPDLAGFRTLFDDGLLGIVNNVGYPNPDRSHFRAMDIWHTADPALKATDDGWLGRVAERISAGDAPPVLHLDDDALPLALRSRTLATPSVADVGAFKLQAAAEQIAPAIAAPRNSASDELLFVQRVAVASCATARRIEAAGALAGAQAAYPDYGLARRLRQIAQLIAGDFGPRVYYTSLDGFDTHARQRLAHGPLLRELGDSVAAFYADLRARGMADGVLLMTFSEFGRRVAENASQGTDHGAAAPLFLVGPGCRSGLLGAAPDLAALDDGDVRFQTDFRSVYAAILSQWLQIPAESVLGAGIAAAPVLRA